MERNYFKNIMPFCERYILNAMYNNVRKDFMIVNDFMSDNK